VFEYRVCWNAFSNISFRGESAWTEYGGFAETLEEVEKELTNDEFSESTELFIDASGISWWTEVREAEG
jgi:hypothetical protein